MFEALNSRIIEAQRFSSAHDIKPQGFFRSAVSRWLVGIWLRTLAPGGRAFFIASGIFFAYGTASLEFQAFVPLAYAFVIWILAYLTRFIVRPVVAITPHHAPRIAAGETLQVAIEVSAPSRPVGFNTSIIPHRLPPEFAVEPANGTPVPALSRGESTVISVGLLPDKRGIYPLQGYRVETDYPFGLLSSSQLFPLKSKLVVYPKFEPLDLMDLPQSLKYQPGGVAFAATRGETVEYIGNREYREGDNVRDIDWRATARLNRPIVREYREEYFLRAAVILDTHLPRQTPEACADFERAVSLCAASADYMNRADYLIDILAAGPNLHHLLAGRGLASLDQILDILAGVESTNKSPWEILAPALEGNLERISSVLCLFLDWDEERSEFATNLRASGVAVKVVLVRDLEAQGPPRLDPRDSWSGEVPVLGAREFELGVRQL